MGPHRCSLQARRESGAAGVRRGGSQAQQESGATGVRRGRRWMTGDGANAARSVTGWGGQHVPLVFTALRHVFRAAPWQGATLVALLALGGLVPVWTIGVTRVLVDELSDVAVTGLTPRLLFLPLVLALAFAVDFFLAPWSAYVHGTVNERLAARVQLDLMEKAAGLPDVAHFENEQFHDELQLLRDGSSYQPLNVLVFLGSAFRELVTSV